MTLPTTTPQAGHETDGPVAQNQIDLQAVLDAVVANTLYTLPDTGTAGTYDAVTTDSKGRVSSGSANTRVLRSVLTAPGSLITSTAASTPSQLLIGTGLQYVRANAGATALEFATLSASTDIPWTLAKKPTVVDSRDEEFEGTAFSGWTQEAGRVETAIDETALITTASQWRYSWNSKYPSAMMIQTANSGGAGIDRAVTINTNDCMYGRFFRWTDDGSGASADHLMGMEICASTGGVRDANNRVGLFVISETGSSKVLFLKTVAGAFSAVATIVVASAGYVNPIEYLAIRKVGTTYYAWAYSPGCSPMYIGTTTAAITADRMRLGWQSTTNQIPGSFVAGCDFLRFTATGLLPVGA